MFLSKNKPVRSRAVRDSARGEFCTVEIPSACNGDPDTTVAAHVQFDGGAMGTKASDLSICYACSGCHDVIDGRARAPGLSRDDLDHLKIRAVLRTLDRLVDKGLVSVKGAA